MIAQEGEHTRGGCKQRRIKAATREATHFDADGAPIESARVPGIVGEVDHLRCLTPVLADYVVRGNTRPAQFEPSDEALVTTLAIVQHYEVDAGAAAAREIGGRSPEKGGESPSSANPPSQEIRLVPGIKMVCLAERCHSRADSLFAQRGGRWPILFTYARTDVTPLTQLRSGQWWKQKFVKGKR